MILGRNHNLAETSCSVEVYSSHPLLSIHVSKIMNLINRSTLTVENRAATFDLVSRTGQAALRRALISN